MKFSITLASVNKCECEHYGPIQLRNNWKARKNTLAGKTNNQTELNWTGPENWKQKTSGQC